MISMAAMLRCLGTVSLVAFCCGQDDSIPTRDIEVSGSVLDDEGRPIVDVRVVGVGGTKVVETKTDARGRYAFELPFKSTPVPDRAVASMGSVRVFAVASGHAVGSSDPETLYKFGRNVPGFEFPNRRMVRFGQEVVANITLPFERKLRGADC